MGATSGLDPLKVNVYKEKVNPLYVYHVYFIVCILSTGSFLNDSNFVFQ